MWYVIRFLSELTFWLSARTWTSQFHKDCQFKLQTLCKGARSHFMVSSSTLPQNEDHYVFSWINELWLGDTSVSPSQSQILQWQQSRRGRREKLYGLYLNLTLTCPFLLLLPHPPPCFEPHSEGEATDFLDGGDLLSAVRVTDGARSHVPFLIAPLSSIIQWVGHE